MLVGCHSYAKCSCRKVHLCQLTYERSCSNAAYTAMLIACCTIMHMMQGLT